VTEEEVLANLIAAEGLEMALIMMAGSTAIAAMGDAAQLSK